MESFNYIDPLSSSYTQRKERTHRIKFIIRRWFDNDAVFNQLFLQMICLRKIHCNVVREILMKRCKDLGITTTKKEIVAKIAEIIKRLNMVLLTGNRPATVEYFCCINKYKREVNDTKSVFGSFYFESAPAISRLTLELEWAQFLVELPTWQRGLAEN